MEKSKRTREVPKTVERLIDFVNALPSEPKRFFYAVDRGQLEEISTEFVATVAELPEELREFIGQADPKTAATLLQIEPRGSRGYRSDLTMRAAYDRYIALISARDALLQIATFNNFKVDVWEAEREKPKTERKKLKDLKFGPSNPIEVTVTVKLRASNQGRFSIVSNPGIEALLDEHMEVERIRLCPICGHIYWAGRINKPACSKKCDNALRQDRWRNKYSVREEEEHNYKLSRIEGREKREVAKKLS